MVPFKSAKEYGGKGDAFNDDFLGESKRCSREEEEEEEGSMERRSAVEKLGRISRRRFPGKQF